jgi:hypothetical protein
MAQRPAAVRVVALVIACLVFGGLAVQLATVVSVSSFHLRGRGSPDQTALYARLASHMPADARWAATTYLARTRMRYAAYPRSPVPVRFTGVPAGRLRAQLARQGVRYVVVTSPGAPAALRGGQAWYRVVYRSDDGSVRLLEVNP